MIHVRIPALLGIAVLIAGCSAWSPSPSQPQATAQLINANREVIGNARLTEEGGGVRIYVQAEKLQPGMHGIHLHAVGKCDPPDFTSSGGHFNPMGKAHGLENPMGPHAGDMPNLMVGSDGKGTLDYTDKLVSLGSGPTSLFSSNGTALVIHAGPDDQKSDPAGNSGARIACGILKKS